MNLRPRGHRPPSRPSPPPPCPWFSHQKAPLVPFLKKNSIWLERNDLLVRKFSSLIRGTWVLNFWSLKKSITNLRAWPRWYIWSRRFPKISFHLGLFGDSVLLRCTWTCFQQKSGLGSKREHLEPDSVELREAALCSPRGRNACKASGPGNRSICIVANFSKARLPWALSAHCFSSS